jgi:hypothetical protein
MKGGTSRLMGRRADRYARRQRQDGLPALARLGPLRLPDLPFGDLAVLKGTDAPRPHLHPDLDVTRHLR